ncbi:43766_t:CDS:2, partial [Gigaspora margarita]
MKVINKTASILRYMAMGLNKLVEYLGEKLEKFFLTVKYFIEK